MRKTQAGPRRGARTHRRVNGGRGVFTRRAPWAPAVCQTRGQRSELREQTRWAHLVTQGAPVSRAGEREQSPREAGRGCREGSPCRLGDRCEARVWGSSTGNPETGVPPRGPSDGRRGARSCPCAGRAAGQREQLGSGRQSGGNWAAQGRRWPPTRRAPVRKRPSAPTEEPRPGCQRGCALPCLRVAVVAGLPEPLDHGLRDAVDGAGQALSAAQRVQCQVRK